MKRIQRNRRPQHQCARILIHCIRIRSEPTTQPIRMRIVFFPQFSVDGFQLGKCRYSLEIQHSVMYYAFNPYLCLITPLSVHLSNNSTLTSKFNVIASQCLWYIFIHCNNSTIIEFVHFVRIWTVRLFLIHYGSRKKNSPRGITQRCWFLFAANFVDIFPSISSYSTIVIVRGCACLSHRLSMRRMTY